MMRRMSEADWKVFREVHAIALERFCERVLGEVGDLLPDDGRSAHERYLAAYDLIQQRDKELANAFGDFSRSTAWQQLAIIHARGLMTENELARFSDETREVVNLYRGL
ncbi:MAG: hypothetical protein WD066_04475 [Planctomycetaceae bacterium]